MVDEVSIRRGKFELRSVGTLGTRRAYLEVVCWEEGEGAYTVARWSPARQDQPGQHDLTLVANRPFEFVGEAHEALWALMGIGQVLLERV